MNLRKACQRLLTSGIILGIPEIDQCLPRGFSQRKILNLVVKSYMPPSWFRKLYKQKVALWDISGLGIYYWRDIQWQRRSHFEPHPGLLNVVCTHYNYQLTLHKDFEIFKILIYDHPPQCAIYEKAP